MCIRVYVYAVVWCVYMPCVCVSCSICVCGVVCVGWFVYVYVCVLRCDCVCVCVCGVVGTYDMMWCVCCMCVSS